MYHPSLCQLWKTKPDLLKLRHRFFPYHSFCCYCLKYIRHIVIRQWTVLTHPRAKSWQLQFFWHIYCGRYLAQIVLHPDAVSCCNKFSTLASLNQLRSVVISKTTVNYAQSHSNTEHLSLNSAMSQPVIKDKNPVGRCWIHYPNGMFLHLPAECDRNHCRETQI